MNVRELIFARVLGGGSSGGGDGGNVSLDNVDVFIGDYFKDDVTVTAGAIDRYERCIVT